MLTEEIIKLYKAFRLRNYRDLFGRIREKAGSLSATEAFAADVIFLLENPTVTQLAEVLGISQPNATYKVNNLSAKGYVKRTASEDDRRECRLQVADKFYSYFDNGENFIADAARRLEEEFSPEDIRLFETMLKALNETL